MDKNNCRGTSLVSEQSQFQISHLQKFMASAEKRGPSTSRSPILPNTPQRKMLDSDPLALPSPVNQTKGPAAGHGAIGLESNDTYIDISTMNARAFPPLHAAKQIPQTPIREAMSYFNEVVKGQAEPPTVPRSVRSVSPEASKNLSVVEGQAKIQSHFFHQNQNKHSAVRDASPPPDSRRTTPAFPCCVCGDLNHFYTECSKYTGQELAVFLESINTCVALKLTDWGNTTIRDIIVTIRRIPAMGEVLTSEIKLYIGESFVASRTYADKCRLCSEAGIVPGTVLMVLVADSARIRMVASSASQYQETASMPRAVSRTPSPAPAEQAILHGGTEHSLSNPVYASELFSDKPKVRAPRPTYTGNRHPLTERAHPWAFTSEDPQHQQAATAAIAMAANETQKRLQWLQQAQEEQYEQMIAWQERQNAMIDMWDRYAAGGFVPPSYSIGRGEDPDDEEGQEEEVTPTAKNGISPPRSISPLSADGIPSIRSHPPPLVFGTNSHTYEMRSGSSAQSNSTSQAGRSMSPFSTTSTSPAKPDVVVPSKGLSANAREFIPPSLRQQAHTALPATTSKNTTESTAPPPPPPEALLAPTTRRVPPNTVSTVVPTTTTTQHPPTSVLMSANIRKSPRKNARLSSQVPPSATSPSPAANTVEATVVEPQDKDKKVDALSPIRCLLADYTPPSLGAPEANPTKSTEVSPANNVESTKKKEPAEEATLTVSSTRSPPPIVKVLKREKFTEKSEGEAQRSTSSKKDTERPAVTPPAAKQSVRVQEKQSQVTKDSPKTSTPPSTQKPEPTIDKSVPPPATQPHESDEEYLRRILLAHGTRPCSRTAPLQFLLGPLISLQASVCDQILSHASESSAPGANNVSILRGRLRDTMGNNAAALLRPLHEICDSTRLRSIAYRLWLYQVTCEAQQQVGESGKIPKHLSAQRSQLVNYRSLCTVCVSFIPAEIGNFQLRLLLECYGIPLAVRVIMPKDRAPPSKGSEPTQAGLLFKMAFVEYSCPEEAARIIADLHGHSPLRKMYLRVEYASKPISGRLRYDAMVREPHLVEDYGSLHSTIKREDLVVPNIKIRDETAAELYASASSYSPLNHEVHPTWREPPLNADAIGHSSVMLPPSSINHPRQTKRFNFYGASGEDFQHQTSYLCPIDGERYWFLHDKVPMGGDLFDYLPDYTGPVETYYLAPCSFGLTVADISTAFTALLDLRRYPMKNHQEARDEEPSSYKKGKESAAEEPFEKLDNPALTVSVAFPGSKNEELKFNELEFVPVLAGTKYLSEALKPRYHPSIALVSGAERPSLRSDSIAVAARYMREATEWVETYYQTKRASRQQIKATLLNSLNTFANEKVFVDNDGPRSKTLHTQNGGGKEKGKADKTHSANGNDKELALQKLRTQLRASQRAAGANKKGDMKKDATGGPTTQQFPITVGILKLFIRAGYKLPAPIDEALNAIARVQCKNQQANEAEGDHPKSSSEASSKHQRRKPNAESTSSTVAKPTPLTDVALEGVVRLATCGDSADLFGIDINTYLPLTPLLRLPLDEHVLASKKPLTATESEAIQVIVESTLVHGFLYMVVGLYAIGVRSEAIDELLLTTASRNAYPRTWDDKGAIRYTDEEEEAQAAPPVHAPKDSNNKRAAKKGEKKEDWDDESKNDVSVTAAYQFPEDFATKGLQLLLKPDDLSAHLANVRASRYTSARQPLVKQRGNAPNMSGFDAPNIIFVSARSALAATRLLCLAASTSAVPRTIVAPTIIRPSATSAARPVPTTPETVNPSEGNNSIGTTKTTANLKVSALIANLLGCRTQATVDGGAPTSTAVAERADHSRAVPLAAAVATHVAGACDVSAISSVAEQTSVSHTTTPSLPKFSNNKETKSDLATKTPPSQCLQPPTTATNDKSSAATVVIPVTKFVSTPKVSSEAGALCAAILSDCADPKPAASHSNIGGLANRNVAAPSLPITEDEIETAASLYFPKHACHALKSSNAGKTVTSKSDMVVFPKLPPIPSLQECRDAQSVLIAYGELFGGAKDDAVLSLIRVFQATDCAFQGIEEAAEALIAVYAPSSVGELNDKNNEEPPGSPITLGPRLSKAIDVAARDLQEATKQRLVSALSNSMQYTGKLMDLTDASQATVISFGGDEAAEGDVRQFKFQGHKSIAAHTDACVLRVCLLVEMMAIASCWGEKALGGQWWGSNGCEQITTVAAHMQRCAMREWANTTTLNEASSTTPQMMIANAAGLAIGLAVPSTPSVSGVATRRVSPSVVRPNKEVSPTITTDNHQQSTTPIAENNPARHADPQLQARYQSFSMSKLRMLLECQKQLAVAVFKGASAAVRETLLPIGSPDVALFEMVKRVCEVAGEGVYNYQAIMECWKTEVGALKSFTDTYSARLRNGTFSSDNQNNMDEGSGEPANVLKLLTTALDRRSGNKITATAAPKKNAPPAELLNISPTELSLRATYGNAVLAFGYLEGRSLATKLLQMGLLLEGGTAPHLASMLYHQAWLASDSLDIIGITITNNMSKEGSAIDTSNTSVLSATALLHGGNNFLSRAVPSHLRSSNASTHESSLNTSAVQSTPHSSGPSAYSQSSSFQRLLAACPNRPVSGRNSVYYKKCVEKLKDASRKCALLATLFPQVHDQLVAAGRSWSNDTNGVLNTEDEMLENGEDTPDVEPASTQPSTFSASTPPMSKNGVHNRRMIRGKEAASILSKAPPTLHRWHVLQGCAMLRDETVFDPTVGEIENRKEQLKLRGLM